MHLPSLLVPVDAAGFWTAFAAVGTFAAVLVALFPLINRLWERPRLKVVAALKPPACHLVELPHRQLVYFLRLWIENEGSQAAENVQVFVAKREERVDGVFQDDPGFLPMNLRWTHATNDASTYLERINPGMGHHCELAAIHGPGEGEQFVLRLALEAPLHWLGLGEHRLTLKVAGSNSKPVTTIIEIDVSGEWTLDSTVMFEKNLRLRIVA
jgi:hypothetical protein